MKTRFPVFALVTPWRLEKILFKMADVVEHNWWYVVVVSDRHTSSVSPYRYPESRDEQKPGPERRDCEAFVIPPKGLMQ